MADELDFSLPEREQTNSSRRSGTWIWWVVLLLQIVVTALLIWNAAERRDGGAEQTPGLDLDAQRKLAMKLEKQGLAPEAASAWQRYLALSQADATKCAEIWYRIGKAYEEAGQYAEALAAYYRSEGFAALPDLEDDVGRRVAHCLEALGKFAALRHELAERTTVGGQKQSGEDVVAEIGPSKLTVSDVDRLVEKALRQQLDQLRPYVDPAQLAQQEKEMFAQLGDNRARRQLLNQYLSEEVLYRHARESGLAEEPRVRETLRDAERAVLARQTMERETARRVSITPEDVKTFYQANLERFAEPPSARVAHILLADADRAAAAIASLADGEEFARLAAALSLDAETAGAGGALPEPIAQGQDELPGVGSLPGLSRAVFAGDAGAVLDRPLRSERGWHVIKVLEKMPARQRPFDEVRQMAYRQLRARKEQEVQQAFARRLFEQYDVVIHQNVLGPSDASVPGAPAPYPKPVPANP